MSTRTRLVPPVWSRPVTTRMRIGTWSLWALPRHVLVFVLAVDLAALVAGPVAAQVLHRASGPRDLVVLALLSLGLVVHSEVARHVERLREVEATNRPWVDLKSVWSFAGVLLLPLGLALLLVLITFAYTWARVTSRVPLHQFLFSAATVVLATVVARAVLLAFPPWAQLDGPLGLVAVSTAALARWTVNSGLVCGVLRLVDPTTPWHRRFFTRVETTVGLGSLALGTVVAALAGTRPWLIPVVLAPIVVMHRGLLVPQLSRAVHTDAKTALATATRWHAQAVRAVARCRRRGEAVAVLMVDIDDFKAVNDRWGHLAGDVILRAVADLWAGEVGSRETVGRFGGEEFVVLITGASADEVAGLAERSRAGTATLAVPTPAGTVTGLSVSVGLARAEAGPDVTVDALLLAADTALYDAKRAGRNRVHTSAEVPPAPSRGIDPSPSASRPR